MMVRDSDVVRCVPIELAWKVISWLIKGVEELERYEKGTKAHNVGIHGDPKQRGWPRRRQD